MPIELESNPLLTSPFPSYTLVPFLLTRSPLLCCLYGRNGTELIQNLAFLLDIQSGQVPPHIIGLDIPVAVSIKQLDHTAKLLGIQNAIAFCEEVL